MNILKTIVLTEKILSGYGQNLKLTGLHRPTYGLIPAGLRLARANQGIGTFGWLQKTITLVSIPRSNGSETSSMEKDEFPIRAYSIKELASLYRVSTKTFRKWLAKMKTDIGPRIGHFYNPAQVKAIVEHLGKPFTWLIAIIMKSMFGMDLGRHDGAHDDGVEQNPNDTVKSKS